MAFTNDLLIDEMNLLSQFSLESGQSGIKVHSSAAESHVSAAKRLFEKGFIDHVDGGYLTSLGREAAEHVHALRTLLA